MGEDSLDGEDAGGRPGRAGTERLGNTTRVRIARGSLLVLSGERSGEQLFLEAGRMTIGSGSKVDVRLTDRGVSRTHCEFEARSGDFLFRDLGSTNGTFVNGARIKEVFLAPGDLISVGTCQLRFTPSSEEIQVPPSTAPRFGMLVGGSLPMRQVYGVLERVAPTDHTLLLLGESGTGKDLAARSVHAASRRASGPFVVFDCSATSAELMAAELFGHMQGAFTGATANREGVLRAARGGTVFLDEIGELPLDLQPMLLRALENREVRPVGSTRAAPIDVRLIAATQRDLASMCSSGKFREDLYYRLAVVSVTLPPLRLRREDIPEIVEELAIRSGGGARVCFTDDAIAVLKDWTWQGNVRELRNVIDRTLALSGTGTIEARHLVLPTRVIAAPDRPVEPAGASLEDSERDLISRTLARTGGNQVQAARILGIHRDTLRRKIRTLGLSVENSRRGS